MVRGLYEIIKDILIETAPKGEEDEYLSDGAIISKITKSAVLTYKKTIETLDYIMGLKKPFIIKEGGTYITTQAGLEFLESYHNFESLLK